MNDSEFDETSLENLIMTNTGLNLNDSIHIVTIDDAGFDLHGTLAVTYTIKISDSDKESSIQQIKLDTVRKWHENDVAYILTVYPHDIHDTLFGFSLLKSDAQISVSISDL